METKYITEGEDLYLLIQVVGERSCSVEGHSVRRAGAARSETAGMSNEREVRIFSVENLRFPPRRSSAVG